MAPLPPNATIGIVGGGQLGRMLAMAAARLGYRTVILDPQADCPAAQVANAQIVAAYDDESALDRLAANSSVVTYEFENVPVAAARRLAGRLPLHPPARALEVAQDRVAEKTFLNRIGLATAPWAAIDDESQLTDALARFGGKGILKTRRLGYDGKGQCLLDKSAPQQAGAAFAQLGGRDLVLEGFVPFASEVSIIAARDAVGNVAAYEPSRNLHVDGILARSTVPTGVPGDVLAEARAAAVTILDALDYVGVIGVEFFVTADRLLVNEIAPRVHNSGHWTEAACAVSQFEQHIRAVAGLPLGDPRRHSDAVMENLIGDDIDRAPLLAAEPDVVLHLYGKAQARAGRKMGHFTRLTGPANVRD